MDMSLVAALLSAQAGAVQQQVATATLKSNLDSQKSAVETLLGGASKRFRLRMLHPASAAASISPRNLKFRQPPG